MLRYFLKILYIRHLYISTESCMHTYVMYKCGTQNTCHHAKKSVQCVKFTLWLWTSAYIFMKIACFASNRRRRCNESEIKWPKGCFYEQWIFDKWFPFSSKNNTRYMHTCKHSLSSLAFTMHFKASFKPLCVFLYKYFLMFNGLIDYIA